MNRKPERRETNAARQQRLRERRKAEGFKRVTLWLSPEQVDILESFGGEPWLGATVKVWLESAVAERTAAKAGQRALFDNPRLAPVAAEPLPDTGPGRAAFMTPQDKAALMREVDRLLSQGLSGGDVARQFNAEGRQTIRGAAFIGRNVLRDWRKWKEGRGEGG